MPVSSMAAYWVLVLAAATLFYMALTDLAEYRIRNDLIFVLVGLFLVHAILSGRWTDIYWNFGAALGVFLVALFFYSKNMMGGGDVKILTVAYLWVGVECALPLAIMMLMFAIIHAVVAKLFTKLEWVTVRREDGRMRIPLAPSVAAALIGTFMLGCVESRPL
jgi:prepilin peptidase CpaA